MEENKQSVTDDMEMDINSDADVPGNTHLSNPAEEEDNSIEKLQEEVQQQKEKYLRLFAEFDNYKRRTSKEKMEMIQTAGKDIILSMLDVLDDCERAEKQMETSEDLAQVKEGNKLVFTKLKNVLSQKGLQPVESINTDFDVEKHEAITEIEAGEEKKGKVVDEVQKGYTLNGKQIRFAKVVVGK
jgi:molecular chaperone GrpE